MDSKEDILEAYFHEHIPISRSMGVRVLEASSAKVRLWAPLLPNINHRGTAFGGSEVSVAVLAAWGWLHLQSERHGLVRLVIQRSEMDFTRPVRGDFEAVCHGADLEAYHRSLQRRGVGRSELESFVSYEGLEAATMFAVFVAKRTTEES